VREKRRRRGGRRKGGRKGRRKGGEKGRRRKTGHVLRACGGSVSSRSVGG
jgi:hypothetical protein